MIESPDERKTIESAAGGDAAAFRTLYLANVDAVFRYALARVGSQEAEEVTAETFARAWKALPNFVHQGKPFIAWLYRIALNVVISDARRQATASRHLTSLVESDGGFEDAVVSALDSGRIAAAVRGLPERQRLVLELRIVRQLSVGEVSELLGISEEATRALTHRALTSLRSRYPSERAG